MKNNCDIEPRTTIRGESCKAKLDQPGKLPEVLHCTRMRGHSGEHHAHNQYGKCYGKWEGKER